MFGVSPQDHLPFTNNLRVRQSLCEGTVNGHGQYVPVHAQMIARMTFAQTRISKNTFCLRVGTGLLGVSWVCPGYLLGISSCLLGAPWPPGCFLGAFVLQDNIQL